MRSRSDRARRVPRLRKINPRCHNPVVIAAVRFIYEFTAMYRHLTHALTCLTIVVAGLAIGMIGASSQDFGDAKRGATLARGLCAECHAVAPGEQSSNQAAPTFERIAGTAGMVGLALEAALNSTHRQMPNVMLSASDRADVIAYIESLRAGK